MKKVFHTLEIFCIAYKVLSAFFPKSLLCFRNNKTMSLSNGEQEKMSYIGIFKSFN